MRPHGWIALLAALAMLGTACSSQPTAPASPPKPAATAAPAAATAAPAAAQPQAAPPAKDQPAPVAAANSATRTVVVAIAQNPATLDPQNSVDAVSNTVTRNIFDFLIAFDENMNLKPSLAESWEFKNDKTFVMKLRKGVKFHDGAPWNAQAAKANLDRLRTEKLGRSDQVAPYVDSVDVIDEYTVQLNMKVAYAPMPRNLAHDAMGMMSPEALKKYDLKAIGRNPVGTGPYIFQDWREGDMVRLKPNPDYWGGAPKIGGLAFKLVPEPSVRTALMRTGEIDMISGVAPADADDLAKQPGVKVINKPSVNYMYAGLNNLHGPLKDKRVRQALNYATDKQSIVKNLLRGYAYEADSSLPPAAWGYAAVGKYPYDIAKAKALMKEAGYESGFNFNFVVPKGRYLMDWDMGQAIQASWQQIGVKVNILTYDWGTLLDKVKQPPEKAEWDGFILNCGSRTAHAIYCLSINFDSANWAPKGSNRVYYKDDDMDKLLATVTVTVDEKKQLDLYKQIQQKVYDDAPWVFLHTENLIVALRDGLAGAEMLPSEQYNFHKAYFTK